LLTLTYNDAKSVMKDLKAIGANTILKNQQKDMEQGLVTPGKLKRVVAHYEQFRKDDIIPASYEVVYGHAWKTKQRVTKIEQTEFPVSFDKI